MPKKGRLIVIDGADGSGKATQTALLVKRMRSLGHRVATFDFPQYERNFFGRLIGECIAGSHGNFSQLDPYITSVLYAADRMETKPDIEKALRTGAIVVLDRYVSSNQLHQAGKIIKSKERKKFLAWLDIMEHKIFGLPRPDKIFYLDVPLSVSTRLLRDEQLRKKKKYLRGKKIDTLEADVRYLRQARESALKLLKELKNWKRIECTDQHKYLLSKEVIHDRLWSEVKKLL